MSPFNSNTEVTKEMERSRTMQCGRQIMLNNTPNPDVKITSRATFNPSRKLSYWINYTNSSSMHRNLIFCLNLPYFKRHSAEVPATIPPPPLHLNPHKRINLPSPGDIVWTSTPMFVLRWMLNQENAVSDQNLARFATAGRTLSGKYMHSQPDSSHSRLSSSPLSLL